MGRDGCSGDPGARRRAASHPALQAEMLWRRRKRPGGDAARPDRPQPLPARRHHRAPGDDHAPHHRRRRNARNCPRRHGADDCDDPRVPGGFDLRGGGGRAAGCGGEAAAGEEEELLP